MENKVDEEEWEVRVRSRRREWLLMGIGKKERRNQQKVSGRGKA